MAGLLAFTFAFAAAVRGEEAADISAMLEPLRAKNELPALAAAVIKDGKLVAIGATGLRRLGGNERVTVDDQWHLGSCTKSITSSVAAMLVERGKLNWDTTVGGTLAKLQPKMDAAWKPVTLEQLLGHRAGAPAVPPPLLIGEAWLMRGSVDQQRQKFVRGLLAAAPDPAPGTKYVYSNQGYAIASEMLTATSGKSWEPLLREMLFVPLGLKSAGFGAQGTPGKADQPWGHTGEGPNAKPNPPGPKADNPPVIWPAGGVHMSIGDFARYAAWHAESARLLKPETFQRLHTPLAGQVYGFGWIATERPWGGKVLAHTGSNTTNLAVVWISPEKKFAVVAATNMAGDSAQRGCDDACGALIQRVLGGGK